MDYKSGGKSTTIPWEVLRFLPTQNRVNPSNIQKIKYLGMEKNPEKTPFATFSRLNDLSRFQSTSHF
jgi:hypothetical protein